MADQRTILPLGGAAQADNDPHRLDYIRRDQHDWPVSGRMSAHEIIAAGIVGGAVALVVWIVLAFMQWMFCWGQTWDRSTGCIAAQGVFWFYTLAVIVGLVSTFTAFLWGRIMRARAEYARATITRDRWSNPVSAFTIHQQDQRQAAGYFLAAAKAEIAMAPHKQYPAGLDSLSINNAAVKSDQGGASDEVVIKPLPLNEWLSWFDSRPHGLLAAETGGGKSTTFKAIVKSRIERGELVFLLDPHSSDWFGLPGIGGGEDWDAVWAGMQVVITEYARRMQERDEYLKANGRELPHDHFSRITVLLDEANTACRKLALAKRGEESKWEQFAKALGSGARKVGISIQLLAQSPNVEDLELSGPMRQNFTRICLDTATTRRMVDLEERDPERKRALYKALEGMEYPATANQKGSVVLLDRMGLNQVEAPMNPRNALWIEGYEAAEQLITRGRARLAVSASAKAAQNAIYASTSPQTDRQTGMDPHRKQLLIRALRRMGKTRAQAREQLAIMGEGLDNDDWAAAG